MRERPPDFLTIDEARAVLAMGRTMAYREARVYIASGGAEGALPAIELKPKVLRVPRIALEELLGGPLTWPPPRLDTETVTRIEPEHTRPVKPRTPRTPKPAATKQSLTVTAPDTERPSAPPTPVVVSSDNGEVVLELADNGDLPDPGGSGVAQFEVLRNTTNADNNFTVIATVTRDGVTTTFPDDTVSVGATYYYALKAIDAAGNTSFRSGYTNPVTVTISGPPATPAAPSVTSDGDGTLTITWDPVAGADSYDIYRDVADNIATGDPANWPNPVGTVTHPTTTWPDPKVFPNDNPHTYRIVASNNAGSSTMSNKGTGTVTNSIWSTALNNNTDQWEIRNPQGQAVQWEAVNVRSYDFAEAPLDGTDIAALAERFNYIRLNLSWQRLQPDNSGPIDAQNGQAEADRVMLFLSRLSTYNTQNPNNQVHVILDFAHLADSKNQFQIPTWAWNAGRAEAAAVGVNFTGTPANRSWYAWAGVDQTGSRVASYIDALADYGIFDHETVIAVEFMNEPHPRNGNVQTAATQGELATVYGNLVDHIRTSTNPDIDNDTLIVLGAFFGGTRFGGTIDANGDFQHNAMATEFAGESNLIWTAHSYYTGYGDILRGGDARNDGQFNDGRRGGDGWAENPETDAGCYSDVLRSVDLLPFAWDCAGGFPNRSAAQLGLRNTAYWNQDYAQQAGMPFFLGEWGVPRQRFQVVNGVGGYRGIDGSELYFCDAMAAFEDPNNDGNTNDRISWAVWSFDARVDGFGLYMSQSQSLIGRDFLTANQWVDTGEFNSNQQAWENYNPNGDDWNYAQPFDPDDPVNGCRQ